MDAWCSGLDYCRSHEKIRPQARPLNHRKTDSSPQSPNSERRPREYLTEKEIERLQDAARKRLPAWAARLGGVSLRQRKAACPPGR
jgi:hypothetical protein